MKLFQKLIKVLKNIGINANKIELSANDILNLLAGNEINLGSEKITIKSDNFSVDESGKMICSDADINGKITSDNAQITGGTLELKDNGNGNYGNKSGNIEINGPTHNSYFYSDGLIIRPIDGSTSSISKNSINLFMYEGEPAFVIRSASGSNMIDSKPYGTIIGTTNENVGIYVNGNGDSIILEASDICFDGAPRVSTQGQVMYGKSEEHKYRCNWTGQRLEFWVDETNVGTLSDKRLKKEIKDIDKDFIKIINEIEIKQFKIANRNGLISFGILAQDLIEIFKKYDKNPLDYEIVQETQYKDNDETIYYTIDYEQFLILKQKATDIEIKQLEKRIEEMEEKNNEINKLDK